MDTIKQNAGWLLERLDRFFENKTFVAGDNFTVTDFFVFEIVETFKYFNQALLEDKLNLLKFHQTISKLPKIEVNRKILLDIYEISTLP